MEEEFPRFGAAKRRRGTAVRSRGKIVCSAELQQDADVTEGKTIFTFDPIIWWSCSSVQRRFRRHIVSLAVKSLDHGNFNKFDLWVENYTSFSFVSQFCLLSQEQQDQLNWLLVHVSCPVSVINESKHLNYILMQSSLLDVVPSKLPGVQSSAHADWSADWSAWRGPGQCSGSSGTVCSDPS